MIKEILLGDCLEKMTDIPGKSVSLILCDLPYGSTNCKWDTVIPFSLLWKNYERIIKPNGAIILTATQPFASNLVMSNPKLFKYSLVWEKSKATGYLNSKKMPMRAHEDILVFYKKPPIYNPQMTKGEPYDKGKAHRPTDVYGVQKGEIHVKNAEGTRYPRSVLYFKTAESEGQVWHPTQKPLALMEYLIKTYTNENDLVLDNCCGAGTTLIAAKNLNRQFIGIEKEKEYYDICCSRLKDE